MSDVKETAQLFGGLLKALDRLIEIDDLEDGYRNVSHRLEVVKKQLADTEAQHAAIIAEAKGKADGMLDDARQFAAAARADAQRDIAAGQDRAEAELARITAQRDKVLEQIEGANNQLADLRHLAEEARVDLGNVRDDIAVAKALHAELRRQLDKIKQAL